MQLTEKARLALVVSISLLAIVALARHEQQRGASSAPEPPRAVSAGRPPEMHEGDRLRDGKAMDPNRASAAELELLPGVGPSLARRLVQARDAQPFRTAEDLLRVKGVGRKTLEKLRPFLKFDSKELEHTTESDLNLGDARGP